MDKLKNTFKDRYREIICICLSCISYYFLLTSVAFAVIATLITVVFSVAVLVFTDTEKRNADKKISYLSFFAAFLFKIDNAMSCKNAYESSVHCLIGYYDLVPYDELLNDPSSFSTGSRYDPYFYEVMDKERNNEVHLFDCSILSDEAYEESERLVKRRERAERNTVIDISLTASVLVVLTVIFAFIPGVAVLEDNLIYNVLAMLVLSFMMPLNLLNAYFEYKR